MASEHGKTPSSKRALLVKLGAIGDVIMVLPAAAALRAAGYTVDWVASAAVAPVLTCYPWVHVIAAPESTILRGPVTQRLKAIIALWRELRRRTAQHGPYDLAATLYYDARYRLLAWPVPSRRRIQLTHGHRQAELLAGRHHTDEYARILLDLPDQERPYQLRPVPIGDLPSPLPASAGRQRIVLVPAGARNALRDDTLRRWPVEHYVNLARALLDAGLEVVLAGGPEDTWASAHFASLPAGSGVLQDCIGKFSLLETLGLLCSAAVTVTHDTGPLHLAGVTPTALVSIFGPTDPRGRLPRRENAMAFWGGEGFACRPCYDGRDYPPCPHNGCMAQITPAMVLDEVQRLLVAKQAGAALPPRVRTPQPAGFVPLREVQS